MNAVWQDVKYDAAFLLGLLGGTILSSYLKHRKGADHDEGLSPDD